MAGKKEVMLYGRLSDSTHSLYKKLQAVCSVQLIYSDVKAFQSMADFIMPSLFIFNLRDEKRTFAPFFEKVADRYPKAKTVVICDSAALPVFDGNPASRPDPYEAFYANRNFLFIDSDAKPLKIFTECCRSLRIEPEKKRRPGKRILCVDDSKLLLGKLAAELGSEYDLDFTDSVQGAIEKIGLCRPDLILLDYSINGGSGLDLFETLSNDEELDRIPVVFLTDTADSSVICKILRYRPEGYLLKPVDRKLLKQKVRECISKDANRTFRQK